MTSVRGAAAEARQRGSEQIEMGDLARIFEAALCCGLPTAAPTRPKVSLDTLET